MRTLLLIAALALLAPDAHALGRSRLHPKNAEWTLQFWGMCWHSQMMFPGNGSSTGFHLADHPDRYDRDDPAPYGFKFRVDAASSVWMRGNDKKQDEIRIGTVDLSPSLCEAFPDQSPDELLLAFTPIPEFTIVDDSSEGAPHPVSYMAGPWDFTHSISRDEVTIYAKKKVYGIAPSGKVEFVSGDFKFSSVP